MARRLLGPGPSAPEHAATKDYVDAAVGPLAGLTTLGGNIITSATAAAVRSLIGAGTSSVLSLADLGVTVTSTEINRLSGVSSNVQTQLGAKEPTVTAGTTTQYWRGDKTWQSLTTSVVTEGTELYFTNARADARITAATGVSVQPYSAALVTWATKTIPAGLVVGTSDTQALINKDLSSGTNTFPTFNQSTTGNAATATRLQSARTINGVSFDGTANITVADSTKQPLLGFTPENAASKGTAGGYASLDGGGKVPVAQLPNSIMEYQGVWNATTNTPTLADGTGSTGDVYRVTVAGSRNLGSGAITFDVGDYVVYNGTVWEKSDTTDSVPSVAGLTGAITVSALKTALSLDLVNNTADASKSVASAATLTTPRTINGVSFNGSANITIADATKEPTITAGTTAQYWRGDKSWQALDKAAVGLSNVDNTSDATRNSATATLANKTLTAPLVSGSTASPAVVQASGTDDRIPLHLLSKDTGAGEYPGEVRIGPRVELHANGGVVAKFQREGGSDNWLEFWSENGTPGIYAYRSNATPVGFNYGCNNGTYSFGNSSGGHVTFQVSGGGNRNLLLNSTGTGTVQANGIPVVTTTGTQTVTNKSISGASNTLTNISADSLVDGTTNKAFLATERTKLTGIATGATANSADATLLARANHTGTQLASTISDFSTAADARVVAGITGKENTIASGLTSQYWRGDKSWQTLDKAAVGLSNVDNTSDATKNSAVATLANKTLATPLVSGSTATPATISASGTDANIGLVLNAKGSTSTVEFHRDGVATVRFIPSGGASPLEFYSESSIASMEATGTNRSLNLVSTGTGTVRANNVPVVTTTGTQTVTNKSISGASNTLSNIALSALSTTGTANSTTYLRGDGQWTAVAGGGGGDASTNTATSVVDEIALFSDTAGKTLKRATGSGIALLTSGVLSAVTAPAGAIVGTTDTQTLTGKTISGATNTLSSIGVASLSATGTADSTTYLRGDGTWATPAGGGADLTNVTTNIVPDTGFSREIGTEAKPFNYAYLWNIKAAGWYMYGNGTPYTTQVIPHTGVTANQSLMLPSATTGVLATEAYVDAHSGGGEPGAAQTFIQEDDPETTNPTYTGPAIWYVLNSSGDIIGKRVRP
jgi:hypothetical protein